MNDFKFNNDDNLNDKENNQIERFESEKIESEKEKSYSLKEEIKRIIDFYKEQPTILILVLFITYLLYYSFKNNSVINNVQ